METAQKFAKSYLQLVELGLHPRLVLLYGQLEFHAGKNGKCHPCHSTLAKAIGLKDRTWITELLLRLRDLKLIEWKRAGPHSNDYSILIPDIPWIRAKKDVASKPHQEVVPKPHLDVASKPHRKEEEVIEEEGREPPTPNPAPSRREEALSSPPLSKNAEPANGLCLTETLPDLFPMFWACFVRAGVALSATDKQKARALFARESRPVQEEIGRWVIEQLQGPWRSAEFTPNPVNALRSRGWERVAVPRTVPKPPTSEDRLLQHILEKRRAKGAAC